MKTKSHMCFSESEKQPRHQDSQLGSTCPFRHCRVSRWCRCKAVAYGGSGLQQGCPSTGIKTWTKENRKDHCDQVKPEITWKPGSLEKEIRTELGRMMNPNTIKNTISIHFWWRRTAFALLCQALAWLLAQPCTTYVTRLWYIVIYGDPWPNHLCELRLVRNKLFPPAAPKGLKLELPGHAKAFSLTWLLPREKQGGCSTFQTLDSGQIIIFHQPADWNESPGQ